jgi:hypothetical protein
MRVAINGMEEFLKEIKTVEPLWQWKRLKLKLKPGKKYLR